MRHKTSRKEKKPLYWKKKPEWIAFENHMLTYDFILYTVVYVSKYQYYKFIIVFSFSLLNSILNKIDKITTSL